MSHDIREILNRSLSESKYKPAIPGVTLTKLYVTKGIFQKNNNNNTPQQCLVCLQNIEYNNYTGSLQCSHIFHYECIRKWIRVSGSCPICRHAVYLKRKS